MLYVSTRDKNVKLSSAGAIGRGLSREGGLFVPETIPTLPESAIKELCGMTYQERAVYVMGLFLDDFSAEELSDFASRAYSESGFDTPEIAPVSRLDNDTYFLELWHGPTAAFKDMALQMLPYFLTAAIAKNGEEKDVCILVATSGDTGKAALEGFKDVDRTKILVFYPKDGVSDIQRLQMTTQEGNNVGVCSVIGNFDDAQTGVKKIFSDEALREELAEKGYFLSSANSINWGRLLPQIVYYISAYCELVKCGRIEIGQEINFCVPTGNFGNILAGYFAKKMGLPVKKLICASNQNNVLTEFIENGVYDKNRNFYVTISPSMDILVSSNLERLIYDLAGEDDKLTAEYMTQLQNTGCYQVNDEIIAKLKENFVGGCCSDEETKKEINGVFKKYDYLMDTHTAVAYNVLEKYRDASGDQTPTVVVSTASPYKFCSSVIEALGTEVDVSGLDLIDKLESLTGKPAPKPLTSLRNKSERFNTSSEKDELESVVRGFLA